MAKYDEKIDRERMEIWWRAKSKEEAAKEMGVSVNTLTKMKMRLEARYDVKLPIFGKAGNELRTNDAPFSDRGVYRKEWTGEDCLNDLIKAVRMYPDKVLSRNFYHIYSGNSESTWNRYFGTFGEFKRQAGVMLSRQAHLLEKNIAKHASMDGYRQLNEERQNWGNAFLRPTGKRFQLGIVGSDFHDKMIDPFFLKVFLDTVKRTSPDWVSFGGDIFDLPEFGKYTVDPRDWDVVGRIKFVHDQILTPVRELVPDVQIDLIEGNHEFRLCRHLGDATPALKVVLSDLHGFNLSKLFGLDKFEINYIAQGDLTAFRTTDMQFELKKNYAIYHDCFMVHHFPEGRTHGIPGINGHHHKHQVWPMFNVTMGSYEWHQIGCGHLRQASYCDADPWLNGFAIVHIDTHKKHVVIEHVHVGDFAVVGGKYYYREGLKNGN